MKKLYYYSILYGIDGNVSNIRIHLPKYSILVDRVENNHIKMFRYKFPGTDIPDKFSLDCNFNLERVFSSFDGISVKTLRYNTAQIKDDDTYTIILSKDGKEYRISLDKYCTAYIANNDTCRILLPDGTSERYELTTDGMYTYRDQSPAKKQKFTSYHSTLSHPLSAYYTKIPQGSTLPFHFCPTKLKQYDVNNKETRCVKFVYDKYRMVQNILDKEYEYKMYGYDDMSTDDVIDVVSKHTLNFDFFDWSNNYFNPNIISEDHFFWHNTITDSDNQINIRGSFVRTVYEC